MKIKENVTVMLSVCVVYAAIIIGLIYLNENFNATQVTHDFRIALSMLKARETIIYWYCALTSIILFLGTMVDSILQQRRFLGPLLSSFPYIMTLVPFVIKDLLHIPFEWFGLIILITFLVAIMLSLRKICRALTRNKSIINVLKNYQKIKSSCCMDIVDIMICKSLFWLLFIMLLANLILLVRILITNRMVFLST